MILRALRRLWNLFLLRQQKNIPYECLIPGIAKILDENCCQYQPAYHGGFCCFKGTRFEMDRGLMVRLMEKDDYGGIEKYLLGIVQEAKKNRGEKRE